MFLNFRDYKENLMREDKAQFDDFFKRFDEHCFIDFGVINNVKE